MVGVLTSRVFRGSWAVCPFKETERPQKKLQLGRRPAVLFYEGNGIATKGEYDN